MNEKRRKTTATFNQEITILKAVRLWSKDHQKDKQEASVLRVSLENLLTSSVADSLMVRSQVKNTSRTSPLCYLDPRNCQCEKTGCGSDECPCECEHLKCMCDNA